MQRVAPCFAAVALLPVLACTGAPGECGPAMDRTGATPLPDEIDDILERRCRMCHSDPTQMFAPMPLVTWEDVQTVRSENTAEPVFEVIGRRIHDERFPMPPLPAPSLPDDERKKWPKLSDEEIGTLDAWIADCAPPAE
jgi:hypothetical protein